MFWALRCSLVVAEGNVAVAEGATFRHWRGEGNQIGGGGQVELRRLFAHDENRIE